MKTVDSPKKPFAGLSRRHFMQSSAVVGSQVLMLPKSQAAATSLEGYASATSVAAGGTIDFFLRDPQAVGSGTTSYPLTITRIGAPDTAALITTATIGNQVVPADASTNGCRWSRSYQLLVPNTWASGLYFAYVGSGANACTVPFVVRAVSSTPGVKTLVMIPATTVHAYNAYGGKSIYDYNSTGGVRAPKVSLDRPFTESFNSFFDPWSQHLVRWMAKNKLAADFCTDIDIEADPALLTPYQLYVQGGHDEYWSLGRRNTMDAFVARGGNAAYLGGNTCWFQARLESGNGRNHRTLVCYKDAAADPITDPALKTINWVELTTPFPENVTTGLGYVTGCSWSGAQPRPNTPSIVMRSEHWAFAGAGLANGNGFGGEYVGYESDSAAFVKGADQKPYATGVDGSPGTLRILAQADASTWDAQSKALGGTGELSGYAAIAVFSKGGSAGTVFNAGSTDWAYGLMPELNGQTPTPISRITLNVINKLARPWTETADVRQYRNVVGGLANHYYTTGVAAPAGSGLGLDGWVFRGFAAAVSGSVPVYRIRTTASDVAQRAYYLSTTNSAPAGMVSDGVAFHAYPSARSDATAIYEHYAFNGSLQLWVVFYSPLNTPPSGFSPGPIRFYAPNEGTPTPAPTPSFTLSAGTASLSAVQGQSVGSSIGVVPVNGFTGTVSFAATGLPTGVSATFSPASSSSGTTLALAASATAAPGSYTVTVTGTAANAPTATTTLTLVITAAVKPPSFTLTPGTTTLKLPFGGLFGGSVSIGVAKQNGFNGTVSFTVTGVPAGLTGTFSPPSSTSGTQLNIRSVLIPPVKYGTYPVTIKGTSGSLTATTVVDLVVSAF